MRQAGFAGLVHLTGLLAVVSQGWAQSPAEPSVPQAAGATGEASVAAAPDTLTILSIDATTLPGMAEPSVPARAPSWRTSFGSERRSAPERPEPAGGIEADLVLLQGVRDVRLLRAWFPARHWKLVVSRQMLSSDDPLDRWSRDAIAPVPTTAVAVRYQPGLRVTGQDHLLALADLGRAADGSPGAAGTAVRVSIAGRETWALSVQLPDGCFAQARPHGPAADPPSCAAIAEIDQWHAARAKEGVRRVTGGRLVQHAPAQGPVKSTCRTFGLRLDPAPPPPKLPYTPARETVELGCAAAVSVAK